MDNRLTAVPAQVNIGAKHKQNTTGTPFNNNYYQEKVGDIVDDEVDSNKEKSGEIADDDGYYDQNKCGEIVDNRSMAATEQVTIGAKHTQNTMESTADPTQVTTHTKNSTNIDTKNLRGGK